MTVRSLMALVLLVSFATSSLEAVSGVVRDGEVHHETAATAAVHAMQSAGEHGHESAQEGLDQEHGSDHQHGTGSDHCTHTHGTPLTPSPTAFACVAPGVVITAPASRLPTGPAFQPLLRPPQV